MIDLLSTHSIITNTERATERFLSGEEDILQHVWNVALDWAIEAGKNVVLALFVIVVGRYIIKIVCKIISKFMKKRNVDQGVQSFMNSFDRIMLTVLLIITAIGALGVNTSSLVALLASAGVAIGMALSGNLQNFVGGLLVLLFKPYRIGDYIEAQGKEGFVKTIQIFHTVLTTWGGQEVYVPNGPISSGNIVNWHNTNGNVRVQWTIGIEYGADVKKAREVLMHLFQEHPLLLKEPVPTVNLDELAASSVNLVVRVWTKIENYWPVYYGMQEQIYEAFNREGINFPFPQLTIHNEK